MPVREDGKWESWETRHAREKAALVVTEEVAPEAVESAPEPKRRTRRSNSAAEAAITKATGATVKIEDNE